MFYMSGVVFSLWSNCMSYFNLFELMIHRILEAERVLWESSISGLSCLYPLI